MPIVSAKCCNCGANLKVDDSKDALTCEHCGSAFVVEKAIKNYNNSINGVHDSANELYESAKIFEKLGESEKALNNYEKMTNQFPADYRGWFGLMGLINVDCKADGYDNFERYFHHAYELASEELKSSILSKYNNWNEQRYDSLCQKHDKEISFGLGSQDVFSHLCGEIGVSAQEPFYKDGIKNAELCNKKKGVLDLFGIQKNNWYVSQSYGYGDNDNVSMGFSRFLFVNGDIIVIEYSREFKNSLRKASCYFKNQVVVNKNIETYLKDLPDGSDKKESGCYIATCVYGSYDCPNVWTLRRFRDNVLDEYVWGRLFIKCYYAISPILVKQFGETKWFKSFWKSKLDSLVHYLNQKGVLNTEYLDKY